MFRGIHSSFNDIFLLIRIPNLLVLRNMPSDGGLHVLLLGEFIAGFVYDYGAGPTF